jgi:hypothetical protein
LIVGTYIPRKSLFFTTELSFTGKNITVYDDDIDKIKRGDKIIDNNNNVAIVSFLSSNAKIITVDSILN